MSKTKATRRARNLRSAAIVVAHQRNMLKKLFDFRQRQAGEAAQERTDAFFENRRRLESTRK